MIGVYLKHFRLRPVCACQPVTGTSYSSVPDRIESGRKYRETSRSLRD